MKKLFVNPVIVLALVASMFLVSSCEKEVDFNQADLIGTWDMGDTSVDAKVGPVSLKQAIKVALPALPDQTIDALIDELMSEFSDLGVGTITFNEDNSYALAQGELGEEGTWDLEGDKLHMILAGESMDENPLIVRSLTSSAAVVAWEEEVELELEGVTFDVIIEIEMNLSKQ
jgi:hypothetical protein